MLVTVSFILSFDITGTGAGCFSLCGMIFPPYGFGQFYFMRNGKYTITDMVIKRYQVGGLLKGYVTDF